MGLDELIARERAQWEEAVERLNQQAGDVRFELVRCATDGFWYIAPSPLRPKRVPSASEDDAHEADVRIPLMERVQWLPRGEFILDMVPERHGFVGDRAYVGRFSYHPFSQEFLPDVLASRHSETIRRAGSHPFNEYQRGIYVRERQTVLLRPYWNPLDEHGAFDPYQGFDPTTNEFVTNTTVRMLRQRGLPHNVVVLKNVNNRIVKEYTPIA